MHDAAPDQGSAPDAVSGLVARAKGLISGIIRDRDGDGAAQRAALLAYAIRIGSAAALFLSQIILARWMGEFEYGIFVLVWTWVQLLGAVAALGFGTSLMRFVPEYRVGREFERLRGILLASRGIAVMTATVVAALGAVLVIALGDRVESYYVAPFLLGFICIPLYALTDVQDGIGRSFDWIGIALLPPYLWRPVLILLFMIVALLLDAPAEARTAMLCAIGATWLAGILQLLILRGKLAREVPRGPRKHQIGLWLKVTLPMLLAESFHIIMINTDVLVLSLFVSPDQVGIYYAAAKMVALVSIVFFAVSAAAGHRFAALHAQGAEDDLVALVRSSAHWSFWPSLASSLGLLVIGYPVLSLFGPAFTAAYPVIAILSVGVLARASIGPAERLLNAIGEQNGCARAYFGSLIMNVTFNLIAIPLFGVFGAALATSLALIGESVLLDRLVRQKVGASGFVLQTRAWLRPRGNEA